MSNRRHFSCRAGVCHYCENDVLTGEVAYSTVSLEPPEDGRVLKRRRP